ncbi:hypothetical protein CHO01_07330 [Cellulomonas hominis]|uniref:Uncharacterized protein n=1 Tax=Cellulomonas hominis TaxID=156981 RepID=A0A511FBF6_9CELL|nr:hypothetical protein [Cellulomonas hominis]MBB5472446.1 hypothetical protein [Cellulomonas hominis]GEL45617.1 hypothetical protein CHO01_07330 [Cellulomonas hominis]
MRPLAGVLAQIESDALADAPEVPVAAVLSRRRRRRAVLGGATAGGALATAGLLALTGSTLADWRGGDAADVPAPAGSGPTP